MRSNPSTFPLRSTLPGRRPWNPSVSSVDRALPGIFSPPSRFEALKAQAEATLDACRERLAAKFFDEERALQAELVAGQVTPEESRGAGGAGEKALCRARGGARRLPRSSSTASAARDATGCDRVTRKRCRWKPSWVGARKSSVRLLSGRLRGAEKSAADACTSRSE